MFVSLFKNLQHENELILGLSLPKIALIKVAHMKRMSVRSGGESNCTQVVFWSKKT